MSRTSAKRNGRAAQFTPDLKDRAPLRDQVVQHMACIKAQLDELFEASRDEAEPASNKKPVLMPTPALH